MKMLFRSTIAGVAASMTIGADEPFRVNVAIVLPLSLATPFFTVFFNGSMAFHFTCHEALTAAPTIGVLHDAPGGNSTCSFRSPDVIGVFVFAATGKPVQWSSDPVSFHFVSLMAGAVSRPLLIF